MRFDGKVGGLSDMRCAGPVFEHQKQSAIASPYITE